MWKVNAVVVEPSIEKEADCSRTLNPCLPEIEIGRSRCRAEQLGSQPEAENAAETNKVRDVRSTP